MAQGVIFAAVYSRHIFVYRTYRQTSGEVIGGFEAAWRFFDGVFAVVMTDYVARHIIAPPWEPCSAHCC